MTSPSDVKKLSHHVRLEFCYSRAKYRQGRKLTSVKAYTINDESKYLVLSGIPAIKLQEELEKMCLRYGNIELLQILPEYPQEDYSEAYLVKYSNIKNARFAKVKLDGRSFYGGVLHVFYAPELESVEETREKLSDRRKSIAALTRYNQDACEVNKTKQLSRMQIRNITIKRYMSQLKDDVARTYQKHFLAGPIASTREEESVSEMTLEKPCNVAQCGSSTQTEFCTSHLESQSPFIGSQQKSEKCSKSSKDVPLKETGKRQLVSKSISQAPKKIRLFKDTKILSFNESEETR